MNFTTNFNFATVNIFEVEDIGTFILEHTTKDEQYKAILLIKELYLDSINDKFSYPNSIIEFFNFLLSQDSITLCNPLILASVAMFSSGKLDNDGKRFFMPLTSIVLVNIKNAAKAINNKKFFIHQYITPSKHYKSKVMTHDTVSLEFDLDWI